MNTPNATVSRTIIALVVCSTLLSFALAPAVGTAQPKVGKPANGPFAAGITPPKLVVVVAIDGLPQEQLLKNYDLFVPSGFRRLMDRGAWFSDAHQGHALTVTAAGHAAILSGAYPYQHGVIGNEWRDRNGKYMYCVGDDQHSYLDGSPTTEEDGTSPRNLLVSTVGDELRYANNNLSRVFAVAGKDRGSILLAGKTGTAYMYSTKTGTFTSTSYYMREHPAWLNKFFAAKPQDKYFKKTWVPLLDANAYKRSVADGQSYFTSYKQLPTKFGMQYGLAMDAPNAIYYSQIMGGPFGDELTAEFTSALIVNEGLGKNPAGAADILGVSFSSHDYINHNFGPESMQSQDHLIRLDRTLATFFDLIDKQVGKGNALIVLTADHGFMNAPEYSKSRNFDAGRIDSAEMREAANKQLEAKFGVPKLIKQVFTGGVTLEYALGEAKGVSREQLELAAMRTLQDFPGINYVFTRTQLETGSMPDTRIGKLVTRTWYRQSSVDLVVIQRPFYYFMSRTTKTPTVCSHGTPYSYDTNVPLMFEGAAWFNAGRFTAPAEVVDIAPTLSAILNIRPPSASEGRILGEALRNKLNKPSKVGHLRAKVPGNARP